MRREAAESQSYRGGYSARKEGEWMIKAIFLDVDNTLFSHTQKKVPDDAMEAIHQFQKKGGLVFMSTGRHVSELKELELDKLNLDGYVMMNGTIILDRNMELVAGVEFQGEALQSLLDLFERKERPVALLEKNCFYMNYIDDVVRQVQVDYSLAPPAVHGWTGNPLYGGVTYVSREEEAEFKKNEIGPGVLVERWGDFGVDLVPHSGGKAYGLKQVGKVYNLKPEEMMAFGDADNDLSMLKYAGIGVAMGNGLDVVKEAADYVTDSVDEGGVANAMKHFGLI